MVFTFPSEQDTINIDQSSASHSQVMTTAWKAQCQPVPCRYRVEHTRQEPHLLRLDEKLYPDS